MISTIQQRRSWRLPAIISLVIAAVALPIAILASSASAEATSVRIGTSSRAIDGTNTWRGTNQLIMYTHSSSQTRVPNQMSNRWGIEVAVNSSGVITAKNNRMQNGSEVGTPIPAGGYVLSGHGWGVNNSGYEWLLANAEVGKAVTLTGGTPGISYNSDGVNLNEPAVTVNGNNVTYNWTVHTNKSVNFRYMQVAVRPSNDTGFNNNTTVNGTRSFTASQTLPSGTYTAFIAYYLNSTGKWVNGPSVEYTVGNTAPPNDTTPPTVSLTSPTNNTAVTKGDRVTLSANATDNVGVAKVEFLVNGNVVNTDTSSPYSYNWNTSSVAAGSYTITAKAYDAANNVSTTNAARITVAEAAPAIEANATVNSVAGTAVLKWSITGSNPSQWTVGRDGTDAGGTGAWSTTIPGNRREHTFNHLRPGDSYTLTVSASDGRTASVIVTIEASEPEPVDTVAPQVNLTSPANNTTVTRGSVVAIAANATDNVGVTKVEFLVNGSVINTDTSSPYSYNWNTANRNAGNYTIAARAYDAANNVKTSPAITVTLTNSVPNPGNGTWLSGVATMENGNGVDPAKYFGDWRGTPVQIGQTWPNTPDVWSLNPSVANSWAGFQGPMSLSFDPGADWKGLQGWRGWSAMANGNMDAWWRAAAQQTKQYRQGKGVTYVSPFYEYNGDWMPWSVTRTSQGMADFRAAWERVAAIWRQEFPGVKLVLPAACSRDVPQAMMPNVNSYDHIGCTIYNAWPWQANGAEAVNRLEVGRQRALANGKSLVITEWANSGNRNEPGGGGDAPGFIQAFHNYFTEHAGTGPGQLEFETFFNIDGYALDHRMIHRSGNNIVVNPSQPQTAAKYRELF